MSISMCITPLLSQFVQWKLPSYSWSPKACQCTKIHERKCAKIEKLIWSQLPASVWMLELINSMFKTTWEWNELILFGVLCHQWTIQIDIELREAELLCDVKDVQHNSSCVRACQLGTWDECLRPVLTWINSPGKFFFFVFLTWLKLL